MDKYAIVVLMNYCPCLLSSFSESGEICFMLRNDLNMSSNFKTYFQDFSGKNAYP